MKLSDTREGKSWLDQFSLNDKPFAKLLLDSLVLVSRSDLVRSLQASLQHKAKEILGCVTLVPVREIDASSYYKNTGNKEQRRNATPQILFPKSLPGSEAPIAHIMTQMKRLDERKFVENPKLKNMRGAKTRAIFFVDDFIGSGNRVNKFLDAYNNHTTIKSWYSYKWVRYYIFCYSMTTKGEERVRARKDRPPDQINYVRRCPTFEQMEWTSMQRQAIEDICIRYAPIHKRDDFALGYEESKGMMVFEHSVPNNTPAILWAGSSSWQPLFPNRAIPLKLQDVFKIPPVDLQKKLLELGQPKLAHGDWQEIANPYIKNIMLVLSAIARHAQTSHQISDITNLSVLEVETIMSACRQWEFLDEYNRLTKTGHDELNYARKVRPKFDQQFAFPDGFYYPQKLRKAR